MTLPIADLGRRILILVPHPDDEVVGCCAAIGRVRAAGAEVFCLFLTTGLPARHVLWPWQRADHGVMVGRRRDEARQVAALLGIEPVAFAEVPSRELKGHLAEARDGALEAITRLGIDAIWAPAYEGGHQDHDAANAIAGALTGHAAVFEFAEYNFLGGRVHSQGFPSVNGTEREIALSDAETNLKRQALALYRSERSNLSYVGVTRECLRPLAACDYARPPHGGRLFYQRFHWVPFRHPRVDFTRPDEVCRALAEFAG